MGMQGGSTGYNVNDTLQKQLYSGLATQQDMVKDLSGKAKQTAGKLTTNFGDAPTLNQNFLGLAGNLQQPLQLGGQLDPRSQQLLSQVQGARANQLAAQNAQVARQVADPRQAAILQQQNASRSALGANSDVLGISQQQDARLGQERQAELGRVQQLTGLTQAGNQANLQQAEMRANLLGLGNQAQLQGLQAQGLPLQAQQGYLGAVQGIASLLSPQNSQSGKGPFAGFANR